MVTERQHEPYCSQGHLTIFGAHVCDAMRKAEQEMNEFIQAFEASKARIAADVRSAQHRPTVLELRAGDLFYHPMVGHMLFVCRGAHPIWPTLQAVVWCSPEGKLSVEALDPRQVPAGQLTNRDETPEQRGLRFRQWYLERKPK